MREHKNLFDTRQRFRTETIRFSKRGRTQKVIQDLIPSKNLLSVIYAVAIIWRGGNAIPATSSRTSCQTDCSLRISAKNTACIKGEYGFTQSVMVASLFLGQFSLFWLFAVSICAQNSGKDLRVDNGWAMGGTSAWNPELSKMLGTRRKCGSSRHVGSSPPMWDSPPMWGVIPAEHIWLWQSSLQMMRRLAITAYTEFASD